ncbi:M81 family metallopeptidase [Pelagibacterium xiamenense]|uniref:M81 family metallopeptidase n=1 Tax=Pelagibacterium xiamenense TaxID=2901140 RepID=UPI001E5B7D18|nr:M81 family metallopeptidase [Pelagibacterium xiamenense]MCD7059134.1 M81 family metallopeptidase [Pelagibacterium xiamenense]
MRIAVGGFHTESSTYNRVLATAEDFVILRGADLLEAPYFAFLGDYDADFLPTFHARAVPGGPIARATYDAFKAEFLDRLTSYGEIDGLYLALHGAASVEGLEDAEGDFIAAARAAVGPHCPIAASYDLHGNLSQPIIDDLDMYSTYRTAPHIDVEETMRRAVTMLVRHLETGEMPHIVWCPVPVVMPGEKSATTDEPARSLYAPLPEIDARDGIWDASLMVGYVWADQARATAASVITGTDPEAMEAAAIELATAYWNARNDFAFAVKTGTITECVDWAMASETAPVILADSGDNPTAGGVGDRADVLGALITADAQGVVLAAIADRPATEAAYAAGVGSAVHTRIGASLDPTASAPIEVDAEVVFLAQTETPAEREAVLRIGSILAVVSARRRPYHNLADFERLGLDPREARIVVVKSGYLSPELAPIANPVLMALSPGAVDQHVERLAREKKTVPTFPFDRDFLWQPKVYASARKAR